MDESIEITKIFEEMYEDLFRSYIGNGMLYSTSRGMSRHDNKLYQFEAEQRCPAQYLIKRALQAAHRLSVKAWTKTKKPYTTCVTEVSAHLLTVLFSDPDVIDFEKLEDIYSRIHEKVDSNDAKAVEAVRTEITDALPFEMLTAIHLYIKLHKIYDAELFAAFCKVLTISRNQVTFPSPGYVEEKTTAFFCFTDLLDQYLHEASGYMNTTTLCSKVCEDLDRIAEKYTAFREYRPDESEIEGKIEEVLNENQSKWDPAKKKGSDTEYYESTINNYLDKVVKCVKRNVIINLKTEYTTGKDMNLRTMRERCSELAGMFCFTGGRVRLSPEFDVISGNSSYQNNTAIIVKSCPYFLLEELWDLLRKYGIKNHSEEKQKPDTSDIFDTNRILLMGRLYMILLIACAFDHENYMEKSSSDLQQKFENLMRGSTADRKIRALLRAYAELTVVSKDTKIIAEILN